MFFCGRSKRRNLSVEIYLLAPRIDVVVVFDGYWVPIISPHHRRSGQKEGGGKGGGNGIKPRSHLVSETVELTSPSTG